MIFNKPKAFLTTRSLTPENQESPIHFMGNINTLNRLFFRRNHYSYPPLTGSFFSLSILGTVQKDITFHYYQILQMPEKHVDMVLECAGNQRSFFDPKVYGEQWQEGAISQGRWTGVSLRELLHYTGLNSEAKEVLFEGYDNGQHLETKERVPYERSLPIKIALQPDILVAYKYNEKPISWKHGGPFRLIVPQWYAMASVKWLRKITVIDHHFNGPYQSNDYVYYPHKESPIDPYPVTYINVNSIIQKPLDYTKLKKGLHIIKGIAWTGKGYISKVELSFDEGVSWKTVYVPNEEPEEYTWTSWEFQWKAVNKGEYTILARAHDSEGRCQSLEAFWNEKGYGYNAMHKVHVKIE